MGWASALERDTADSLKTETSRRPNVSYMTVFALQLR
jgi:hypothetical protein